MEKIIINGGNNRLVGTVKIEGAKNAVLPLLAATVLASEGVTTLKNVPVLSDVYTMNNVVRGLNAQVTFNEEENTVVVDAQEKLSEEAPYKYVSKMRASIVVLGPVLARNGHAKVSMPGGCTCLLYTSCCLCRRYFLRNLGYGLHYQISTSILEKEVSKLGRKYHSNDNSWTCNF